MLYHLLYPLHEAISAFNVFRYLTFRSMLAFFVALLLVLLLQPRFIRWVRNKQFGQPIRDDGPESHLSKQGTPTMGGVIIVLAILLSTLLFADLTNVYIWVLVALTTGYAILGFADDYKKVSKKNTKGVQAKTKLLWQIQCEARG